MANYDVNYNDKRLTEVTEEEKKVINDTTQQYTDISNQTDKFYKDQAAEYDQFAEEQKKNANERLEFDIQKIEQQRDQSKKDYTKEQSGAYADWQKESNQYGVNAEKTAAMGMGNSGYSESSQVRMYTAYQNRVATAREAFTRINMNYDNMIQEAKLQNNSLLAEIAFETFQKQSELLIQGFNAKNQLLLELADKKLAIKQMYHSKYQDVLKQINTENAFAYQREQDSIANARAQAQLDLQREQFEYQKYKDNGGLAGSTVRAVSGAVKKIQKSTDALSGSKKSTINKMAEQLSSTKKNNKSNEKSENNTSSGGNNATLPKGMKVSSTMMSRETWNKMKLDAQANPTGLVAQTRPDVFNYGNYNDYRAAFLSWSFAADANR